MCSRNELGDGIAVDTGWFWMLRQHSNTIYGRNIGFMCGELWRMWYWYVIGKKKWNLGGGTRCVKDVNIRGHFLEAKNPCFVTKNCWKSSYICVFILSKKGHYWFHKNLHNSGMVSRRKLPDSSLNHIFNALSIGVQYTLSFQLTNFGLKCLI